MSPKRRDRWVRGDDVVRPVPTLQVLS